jgi:hypothetical protein
MLPIGSNACFGSILLLLRFLTSIDCANQVGYYQGYKNPGDDQLQARQDIRPVTATLTQGNLEAEDRTEIVK